MPAGEKQRGRPNEPDFVGICLTLVRLVEQNTDIVITINVPHVANEYDKATVDPARAMYGPLLETAIEYRRKILESFEIKDWDLFIQD